MSVYQRGNSFRTNRWAMRDRDYEQVPAEGLQRLPGAGAGVPTTDLLNQRGRDVGARPIRLSTARSERAGSIDGVLRGENTRLVWKKAIVQPR